MAERCVPQVVAERNGFGQVLVLPHSAGYSPGYLSYLERVRKPRPVMVSFGGDEDLHFMHKSSERFTMYYPVAVALKRRAQRTLLNGDEPACGFFRKESVFRKKHTFHFVNLFFYRTHLLDCTLIHYYIRVKK
jgi:hypothetical protein